MAGAPVFYGWWVALAFSVMIFLSTGVRFAVGPFLKPMVADLGLDRGTARRSPSPACSCSARAR